MNIKQWSASIFLLIIVVALLIVRDKRVEWRDRQMKQAEYHSRVKDTLIDILERRIVLLEKTRNYLKESDKMKDSIAHLYKISAMQDKKQCESWIDEYQRKICSLSHRVNILEWSRKNGALNQFLDSASLQILDYLDSHPSLTEIEYYSALDSMGILTKQEMK